MTNKDFYNIIDSNLSVVLERHHQDPNLTRHKAGSTQQQSFAFLIWFLNFYGGVKNYTDYVTDGNNDGSCDIIYNKKDKFGNEVFYIVQSKWNTLKNALKEGKEGSNKKDILHALSDFNSILGNDKKNLNEKVTAQLEKLTQHTINNGVVKFIFLTLSPYKGEADENIATFLKENPNTEFEVIDIERIKSDYIDREYKDIRPIDPLTRSLNPENIAIDLEIVQKESNLLKIDGLRPACILLLRPKTIYELFEKYNFALFFKNVRNPLLQSNFNEQIKDTMLNNPAYFWYYNNGVTAITRILPKIRKEAKRIRVEGLQIINGAQTVYAIYHAYKNAPTPTDRAVMDKNAYVTLRLMESIGTDFDLDVTRYTNSQNPVLDRDFRANDTVQTRLQNESYKTNVWYERRRGEFRNLPEGVQVVSNEEFAKAYLAFYLKEPYSLFDNLSFLGKVSEYLFTSENDSYLYNKVFNENTAFSNMLLSWLAYNNIAKYWIPDIMPESVFTYLQATEKMRYVLDVYVEEKYPVDYDIFKQFKKELSKMSNNLIQLIDRVAYFVTHEDKYHKLTLLFENTFIDFEFPTEGDPTRAEIAKQLVQTIDNIQLPNTAAE